MEIVERARLYISKMPPAISGSGGHDRTYAVASVLVQGFGLQSDLALSLLREWNGSHCEPRWTENELVHKIESVRPFEGKPRGYLLNEPERATVKPYTASPSLSVRCSGKWPEMDHGAILGLLEGDFFSLADLEELSPVPVQTLTDPYALIDYLFGMNPKDCNPWLCLGGDVKTAATRRRSDWQGHLERAQFIVPNPMTGPRGATKDGRVSERCLSNTGPRRYLVIECDFDPKRDVLLFSRLDDSGRTLADLCAAVLGRLMEYAPLVMAVHSGSKSLHGWFAVGNQPTEKLRRFMAFACSLGADKATWTPCQFVRMPCGIRDNGNRQTVHYFNHDSHLLSA